MRTTQRAAIFAIVACIAIPSRADVPLTPRDEVNNEATQAEELAQVQGRWSRTMKTDRGTFKVVKEHDGNKTTVTVYDSEGNVLVAKRSEFRLEKTGKVRILTFFNNTITAGPQQGQTNNEPQSYIYRIIGDTFVEANGLLNDDPAEPLVFSWKRLSE